MTKNVTVLTDANGVQREYNGVKRKANVGERVLIVSATAAGGAYKNGDVLCVTNEFKSGDVFADTSSGKNVGVFYIEYLTLTPTSTVIIDGVRYREEKRKAAVGERILATGKSGHEDYEIGEVLTVEIIHGSYVTTRERSIGLRNFTEYVVLTPISEPVTQETLAPASISFTINVTVASMDDAVQAVADAVKAELAKVQRKSTDELCMTIAESIAKVSASKPKTPQELRDEIVERAKRDVAELSERMQNSIPESSGNSTFRNRRTVPEFHVNKEKRTVTALAKCNANRRSVLAKGIAKAAPGDVFNTHIGRAIALRRALGLEVPAEYTNAPQPTEVRVGDVVDMYGADRIVEAIRPKGYLDWERGLTLVGGGWAYIHKTKVLDDSREEVSA